MEQEVRNLTRLVDDLLDVSRITCGKIHLRKENIDLAAAVIHAVEAVRPLTEAQHHELTVSLPTEPVHLEADPTRLEQVLCNLLNNAAKYTERGGHIHLAVIREGTEVVVRLRDTGIGIARELLPRIFDLFAQADRSLARSQGGLGIGLTLVKKLVEMMGGTVQAHSDGPGMGSEFTLRLPAIPEASQEETSPEKDSRPSGRQLRVLVVDDIEAVAEMLVMLLKMWGHDVRAVHDGPTAVVAARTYRPDVIFLDIGLPGMNGYDVARELRQEVQGKKPLIAALTGYGQEEDRRRSREAGFDHHMVKPIDPIALEAFLAAVDSVRQPSVPNLPGASC
jgi:CheY-like chemotaxis protein